MLEIFRRVDANRVVRRLDDLDADPVLEGPQLLECLSPLERRRLERRALTVAAIVGVLITGWLVFGALQNGEKFERGQAVQVPQQIAVPKKD